MGDLGKLIVAKGFKKLPKYNKLPNLVTLVVVVSKSTMMARDIKKPSRP